MPRLPLALVAVLTPIMTAIAGGAPVRAAELMLVSTNGVRGAVVELARRFEEASGHKVALDFEVTGVLGKRIAAGDAFDVAILGRAQMLDLVKQGRIAGDTHARFGRTGMGIGVRKGGPRPDIGSREALRRMLLDAKSIAYAAEGGSGREFWRLIDQLGIAQDMRGKAKAVGSPTIRAVVTGETEFVFSGLGLILADPAVDLVGPVPQELQTYADLSIAVGAATQSRDAALALVKFFTDPAPVPVLKTYGVEAGDFR